MIGLSLIKGFKGINIFCVYNFKGFTFFVKLIKKDIKRKISSHWFHMKNKSFKALTRNVFFMAFKGFCDYELWTWSILKSTFLVAYNSINV